jgi:transcriptional regulator with XRE-family HTH domain
MGPRTYADHPQRRSKLIEARKRRHLSRGELADQLGLTRQYVFRVEEGLRNPRHETMVRWATALKTTMDLFRGDEEPRSQSAAE